MDELEGRPEDDAPRNDAPRGDDQGERQTDAQPRFNAPGDFRPRRRGRRGRGGQRFGGAPRGPGIGGPRPASGAGAPPRADDEDSSQARELAAYERRQQQQRGRAAPFRGPGWVAGARPQAAPGGFRPQGGSFRPQGGAGFRGPRPMGGRGPRRGAAGGPSYSETIRRVTAGPRAQAAPSHEAGEPIAGPHAVLEAIRAGRVLKRLFVSNERGTQTGAVQELIQEAQQRRIFIRYVDAMEIQRLSPIEGHQGVVAIAEGKPGVELDEFLLHLDALSQPALVLAIDSLQDPQNFGVLLRSAEGAGVDGVIIPKHRAVGLTPAVAKTSAGASEHLMMSEVANLRQAIDALKEKGIWVVGTDEAGDLLYDEVDYRGPTAIVVGGEAEGIRRLVLEGCDQVVRIPMEGHVASLNAAAAGTVLLYEALRQRRRNVPPSETRTPPPARPAAVTPQEEDMAIADGDVIDAEGDEAELEGTQDIVRADGEILAEASEGTEPEVADDEAAEAEAIDAGEDAETVTEGDDDAIAKAPAKRGPRAKKPAPPRKRSTRKNATE